METFEALVVGGGPAGSTCARSLVRAGLRVAVLDAARFPRVKLCAGWISRPIWDVLELAPKIYPYGLWEWNRAHVHYAGKDHSVRCRGHFIRRYEFDEFLLRRSGATLVEGHRVRDVRRNEQGLWIVDGAYQAPVLVGAGGTHCPVAHALFPKRPDDPVTTQEHEFETDAVRLAACRPGRDGEPELLLHEDLQGYSWNVPKTNWINIGCGTVQPLAVLPAWKDARRHFVDSGHIPVESHPMLETMRGHSYHLYTPRRPASCEKDGVYLVGDALGLAHPLTGEGILPAAVSGRLCATQILGGTPGGYGKALECHPVFEDYRFLHDVRELGLGSASRGRKLRPVVARVFAWLFSGKSVPGRGILSRVIRSPRTRSVK